MKYNKIDFKTLTLLYKKFNIDYIVIKNIENQQLYIIPLTKNDCEMILQLLYNSKREFKNIINKYTRYNNTEFYNLMKNDYYEKNNLGDFFE